MEGTRGTHARPHRPIRSRVERLTGSLVGGLLDTADDDQCLQWPLEALLKYLKNAKVRLKSRLQGLKPSL